MRIWQKGFRVDTIGTELGIKPQVKNSVSGRNFLFFEDCSSKFLVECYSFSPRNHLQNDSRKIGGAEGGTLSNILTQTDKIA